MALTIATNDWMYAKAKGLEVGVMAFNLSSAFDTLEHKLLLHKLEGTGINGIPFKWFESYLFLTLIYTVR